MKQIKDIEGRISALRKGTDGMAGLVTLPNSGLASIVISWGGGWEHASVSPKAKKTTPTWKDMCWVKDLIWGKDEEVMQIHPAESEYVNIKQNCLHLWKPIGVEIPTPPNIFV